MVGKELKDFPRQMGGKESLWNSIIRRKLGSHVVMHLEILNLILFARLAIAFVRLEKSSLGVITFSISIQFYFTDKRKCKIISC